MIRTLLTTTASVVAAAAAFADGHFQPAVIFDMGGKFDKSFNEAAYNGAEAFKADTGVEYLEFEITDPSQRESVLREFAELGANPIVVMGFAQADAMAAVAPEFPDTNFSIVDVGWLGGDNLRQYIYEEHKGSYLVGVAAALASETGTVSFVGGMDIPLIRKFACGYELGVKSVNADAGVIVNMTGTTPAAWGNPTRGAELARGQFADGSDVVFAAAGGTGVGVLQAADDEGKLSIGVDSNQNGLQPGSVLTSMLKRVDLAVYETFMTAMDGEFEAGLIVGEVGVAVDENNAALWSDEIDAAVTAAAAGIEDGSIDVFDFTADASAAAGMACAG